MTSSTSSPSASGSRTASSATGRSALSTAATSGVPATSSLSATPPFEALPGRPRPKRVENGQVAVVDSVNVEQDTVTLLVREPGAAARLVEIDQGRLRRERAAGERAAAVRLQYAMHSFPAQGATVQGTATLAGHWSQAKRETYLGDTRAVYRHSVHVAREDLGLDGTDEDRIIRYAHRISENRQRLASIRSALDPTLPARRRPPTTSRCLASLSRQAQARATMRRNGSSSSSGRGQRSGSRASGGSARRNG